MNQVRGIVMVIAAGIAVTRVGLRGTAITYGCAVAVLALAAAASTALSTPAAATPPAAVPVPPQ